MKVMVLVKATTDSEAGIMPSTEMFEQMDVFNQQLIDAGIMQMGEGLHPSSAGYRVKFSGKDRAVVPGPFEQVNELVAGFWLWEVSSMDEAIQWVKRCPNPMPSDSEIEIRRLYTVEDFGDAMSPELRERENQMRQQLEKSN